MSFFAHASPLNKKNNIIIIKRNPIPETDSLNNSFNSESTSLDNLSSNSDIADNFSTIPSGGQENPEPISLDNLSSNSNIADNFSTIPSGGQENPEPISLDNLSSNSDIADNFSTIPSGGQENPESISLDNLSSNSNIADNFSTLQSGNQENAKLSSIDTSNIATDEPTTSSNQLADSKPEQKVAFLEPILEAVPLVIEEAAPLIQKVAPGIPFLPSIGGGKLSDPPGDMPLNPYATPPAGTDKDGMLLINNNDNDIKKFIQVAYELEESQCIPPNNQCLNHKNGNAARVRKTGDRDFTVDFSSKEPDWNGRRNDLVPLRPNFGKSYPQGDQIAASLPNAKVDAGWSDELRGFLPKVAASAKCMVQSTVGSPLFTFIGSGKAGVYAALAAMEFIKIFGPEVIHAVYMFGSPNFLNWHGSTLVSLLFPGKIFRFTKPNFRITQSPGPEHGYVPILEEYFNGEKANGFNKLDMGGGKQLYRCSWPPPGQKGLPTVNPNCSARDKEALGTKNLDNNKWMDMPINKSKCKQTANASNNSPQIASADVTDDSNNDSMVQEASDFSDTTQLNDNMFEQASSLNDPTNLDDSTVQQASDVSDATQLNDNMFEQASSLNDPTQLDGSTVQQASDVSDATQLNDNMFEQASSLNDPTQLNDPNQSNGNVFEQASSLDDSTGLNNIGQEVGDVSDDSLL
ncbi:hypothetical protein G9A89_006687 [Geosiphon pyriformis]|nr:hypothetical protein G9A89_006687 [Geosiphon pyriformis]